jgi:hypothetical protein
MRLDRVYLCHPGCDKDAAEAAALYISARDILTGKGHDSEQLMEREREGRERKERWMTAAAKRLWFVRLTARERSGKQSSTPTLHLSPSSMHAGRLYSVLSIFWLVALACPGDDARSGSLDTLPSSRILQASASAAFHDQPNGLQVIAVRRR